MAVFRFDEVHLPHGSGEPPAGRILGALDPGFSGAGTFDVRVEAAGDGDEIAAGTAESADGSQVPMAMEHGHPGPSENVRVLVDGVRQGDLPQPIRLRP